MKTSDFNFDLPNELIARFTLAQRSSSRLLSSNKQTGDVAHGNLRDLLDFFHAGDLIVFNNTKVLPALLYDEKLTGGKLEVLIERGTGTHKALAHVRSLHSPKPGSRILLEG